MKRVLVTGASSFTGRYLVPKLVEQGHEVHGVARPGDANGLPAALAGVLHAELSDIHALQAALERVQPDWVVHLAAVSFVAHGNVRDIYETNLLGSRNLLQAIADVCPDISAVLMASSANIYGNRRTGALTEDVPPQPVNDYGISKLAMEHVAQLFASRIPITIVRPFNYTGVGQSTDFIIPKIVDHARRRASTINLGNIEVKREFSDVRGVAEAYVRLLGEPASAGGTFNVCSGEPHSLREVIGLVESLSGHRLDVAVDPSLVRPNEVRILFGDNSRLAATIGPVPMPPLSETLQWMLEA